MYSIVDCWMACSYSVNHYTYRGGLLMWPAHAVRLASNPNPHHYFMDYVPVCRAPLPRILPSNSRSSNVWTFWSWLRQKWMSSTTKGVSGKTIQAEDHIIPEWGGAWPASESGQTLLCSQRTRAEMVVIMCAKLMVFLFMFQANYHGNGHTHAH